MPDAETTTETTTPPGPSSKSIARYDGPRTIDELERYSLLLAVTTLPNGEQRRNETLPVAFRGNPAGVAFAVEYAKALDVSPITALIGMHIIDGKPTASAGLISALVRRAGHRIRTWTEGSIDEGTFKAITTIERFDDPGFVYRSEWTLERAVRASLMRRTDDGRLVASKPKSGWDNYPENMCKSRTITEAARDGAEDAILGVHYTPEELGVDVDETGEPIYTVTTLPPRPENPSEAVQEAAQRAAETVRQSQAGEPEQAPEKPAETPTMPTDVADDVRQQILEATGRDALAAAWSTGGSNEAAFRGTEVADENGETISLYDLFARAVEACKVGTAPLLKPDQGTPAAEVDTPPADPDGAVDAVIVEDRGGHNHDPETDCVKGCPKYDPWAPSRSEQRVAEKIEKLDQDVANAGTMPAGSKPGGHREEAAPEHAARPEPHDVPSVQIGDPRHGVAIPGDSTAEERADALRHLPIPDARAELDRLMAELPKFAQDEVVEWAKSQGMNPAHSAGNCAAIASAVAVGTCFSDATLGTLAAGDWGDPIALVIRILGGTVIAEERVTDPAVMHQRELEERGRGTAYERSQEARQAAREAVRSAKTTR